MVDVEAAVLAALEEIVQTDEVRKNPNLPLFESGLLDSLGVVQLLGVVSRNCGVDIPLTSFDAATWDTPRHIVDHVKTHL